MIDKISGPKGATGVGSTAKTSKAGGAGFAKALAEAGAAREVASVASVSGITAIMPVIEPDADEQGQKRRRAVLRGEALLEELEGLKLALLNGSYPTERLEALLKLTQSRMESTQNEELNALLVEIDLRARVELAKLGKI